MYLSKNTRFTGSDRTFECEQDRDTWDAAYNAMDALMQHTNMVSSQKIVVDAMLAAFLFEHRTNQQSFIRAIVGLLAKWGKQPKSNVSDLRNAEAYEFAAQISKMDLCFPLI